MFSTLEPLMGRLMALIGREAPRPFRRMPYAEAIAKYGSDKPDLRCGMEISDLSAAFAESTFAVFRDAIDERRRGARVRRARRRAKYSRRELDELVEQAKQLGGGRARVGARAGGRRAELGAQGRGRGHDPSRARARGRRARAICC